MQLDATVQNLKSGQEVAKVFVLPKPAKSSLSKTHKDYWKARLEKRCYSQSGTLREVNEWSVRIQHLGKRMSFALGTSNAEVAAVKARDIYLEICAKGWSAAATRFNPEMVVHKDDPTVGEFLAEVAAKSGLEAKTLRTYASCLRTIVSGCFRLDAGRSKFDYREGGAGRWRTRVEGVRLAALTPDLVQAWKVAYLKRAGTSPKRLLAARRTVNSYLRCARSLFAADTLAHVKVRLPNPLPFAGVALEKRVGEMRYQSNIDATKLVAAARAELKAGHPESYKAFLLALFCGLRRSEMDLLEISSLNWQLNTVFVATTEHFDPKTPKSEDSVEVDPEVMQELRALVTTQDTPFVMRSPLPTRTGLDRQYYRCQHVFEHLTGWLRQQGITAAKPLHELRKEFGSLVNASHGIYAASRALRHSDITTSARHYIAKKQRVTVGLGHLLAAANGVQQTQTPIQQPTGPAAIPSSSI